MKKNKITALIVITFMFFTGNTYAVLENHRQIDVTIKNINLNNTNISLLFPVDYIEVILSNENIQKYSVSTQKLSDIKEITKYIDDKNYLQALKIDNSGDVSISAIEGLDGNINDNYFFYKGKEYIEMNISDVMKDKNYNKSNWPKNSIVFTQNININYDKTNIKILIDDTKLNKSTIISLDNYKYEKVKNSTNSYLMNIDYTYSKMINKPLIIILFIIVLLLFFSYYHIKNEPSFKNKTTKWLSLYEWEYFFITGYKKYFIEKKWRKRQKFSMTKNYLQKHEKVVIINS